MLLLKIMYKKLYFLSDKIHPYFPFLFSLCGLFKQLIFQMRSYFFFLLKNTWSCVIRLVCSSFSGPDSVLYVYTNYQPGHILICCIISSGSPSPSIEPHLVFIMYQLLHLLFVWLTFLLCYHIIYTCFSLKCHQFCLRNCFLLHCFSRFPLLCYFRFITSKIPQAFFQKNLNSSFFRFLFSRCCLTLRS